MIKYFDIHTHLFSRSFFAKELLYRLITELKKMLFHEPENTLEMGNTIIKLQNVIRILKRFSHALRIFRLSNSTAICKELYKTYKEEFIITPLTFDLTYCFLSASDQGFQEELQPSLNVMLLNEVDQLFATVEQQICPVFPETTRYGGSIGNDLWKEYLSEKERFNKNVRKLRSFRHPAERELKDVKTSGGVGDYKGWEEQIRQMTDLKNQPGYQNRVFPFLAVDPRRPGIEDYAKINVGRGKLFSGIKLYCPNGYSPTDPLLYGPDGSKGGIYAFCEENGIPVTVHNSDGGFATLSKSVRINGWIHLEGQLVHLDNELLTFENSILDKDAIYERAVKLNHPLIWKRVVEKYPGLILNLAHFGGEGQLKAALDRPDDETLWSNRIILLLKDDRYRIYTDLSCFSDFGIIRKLIASPVYPAIRGRILYGSDFTLLLLFEDDFDKNVSQFKEIFGNDFNILAGKNPREFLKKVI